MTTDFRALCGELMDALANFDDSQLYHEAPALISRARAALAEGDGVGVTDEELYDLWDQEGHEADFQDCRRFARAALARHDTHPRPIPVAERPWEREGFCDPEGRCWVFHHSIGVLVQPDSSLGDAVCFPAAAIPLPEASP
jgi:hypothetical protein